MYPVIDLGHFSLRSYGLARALAILVFVGGLLLRLRRGRWPVTIHDVVDASPLLAGGLLLGGYLDTALPRLVDALRTGVLPPQWWSGLQWTGGLLGVSLGGYLFCRRRRLPIGRPFDLFAPLMPLLVAVARVGCLMAGCCYGRETDDWPALYLPDFDGHWAYRYPTQIASIAANVLIFLVLVLVERMGRRRGRPAGWPFPGFLYLLFCGLYYGQRFYFETWRATSALLVGSFTWPQAYCLLALVLVVWLMVRGFAARRPVEEALVQPAAADPSPTADRPGAPPLAE